MIWRHHVLLYYKIGGLIPFSLHYFKNSFHHLWNRPIIKFWRIRAYDDSNRVVSNFCGFYLVNHSKWAILIGVMINILRFAFLYWFIKRIKFHLHRIYSIEFNKCSVFHSNFRFCSTFGLFLIFEISNFRYCFPNIDVLCTK